MIFEASLFFFNIPKGRSVNDLKNILSQFKDEMYAEKGNKNNTIHLHFYKISRAKDAFSFLKNTPNEFC